MLITIKELSDKINIKINGILHIGAHTCEELSDYLKVGVTNDNIYWVEALEKIVTNNKQQIFDNNKN